MVALFVNHGKAKDFASQFASISTLPNYPTPLASLFLTIVLFLPHNKIEEIR